MKTFFMRHIVILLLCLVSLCHGAPERIPIGFVVKQPAQSILSAFRYAISQHNSNQNPMGFKLDPRIDILDNDDVLSVGRVVCQQMKKGIFALMGLTQTGLYSTLHSYSQSFHMPYINLNFMPNQTSSMKASSIAPSNSNFHLNLRPFHAQALVDLVRHYGWKDVIYLFDSEEAMYVMNHVVHEMAVQKRDVRVQKISTAQEGYEYLKSVDHMVQTPKKHVILDMSAARVQELITLTLEDKAMMRKQYHYLMAPLGVEELNFDELKFTGVNMTAFSILGHDDERYKSLNQEWMQLDPEAGWLGAGSVLTTDAALELDAVSLWVSSLNRLFKERPGVFQNNFRRGELFNNGSKGLDCSKYPLEHWEHGKLLMHMLRTTRLKGLTGEVNFDEQGDRRNYTLNLMEMTFNRKVLIGTWNENDGLLVTKRFQFVDAVAPPKGKKLIVSSILEEPYLMIKRDAAGKEMTGEDRYEGFCVDMLQMLAKKANISYEIRLVKDKLYGVMDDSGNWNGMIGELIRGEADLVVAPLTITSIREQVVDFTKPFMTVGIGIMIEKPLKEGPGVFSFMSPLSWEVWLCILFAYLGVSIVLFLVSRFSPYEWHIEETFNGPVVVNEFSMYNTLWFSLGAFMQQGGHIYPRSLSGRFTASVWWFFTLIIISSYTANLAAFLTVERLSTPIKNVEELSKQHEIEYGMITGGSTFSFFKKSQVEIYQKMWQFMQKRPHVIMENNKQGFDRVRNSKGRYALLAETPVIEYINNRVPCNTMKVGEDLDSKGYGIATPVGSLLTETLSQAILDLKEDGTLTNLHSEWWYRKGQCPKEADNKDNSSNELQLNNVAGCFYILIIGLILSMISAIMEFLYKAQKDARRHAVSMAKAVKAKAKFSVQGGAFKDPKQLSLGAHESHSNMDGMKGAIFRKSHTQV